MGSELNAALAKAQAEFPDIPKDKVNPHFKSKYASLDSMLSLTRQPLAKHGFASTFRTSEKGLECVLLHSSGEEITSGPVELLVQKNDMQGYGSSLTYAKRYSFGLATGISPDEDDDGNAAAKAAPKAAPAPAAKPKPAPEPPAAAPPKKKTIADATTPSAMNTQLEKFLKEHPVATAVAKWKSIYDECLEAVNTRVDAGTWKFDATADLRETLNQIKTFLDTEDQSKEAFSAKP